MAKNKTVYVCQECGHESLKWLGKCPACSAWNSMVEEIVQHETAARRGLSLGLSSGQNPVPIGEVNVEETPRFSTGSGELNRVLGGGLLPGSLTMIVGDPGVGKSSMTIKVCSNVAAQGGKVLYVTGEESTQQIKLRADRLSAIHEHLYVLSETNLEVIEQQALKLQPSLLVIDSIQTIFQPELSSAPGSVSQVRECAVQLLKLAKSHFIATCLVGHVLKDGSLAGPRTLEHIVDTVLYFEGDRNAQYRILRAIKNRFGSTNELGLFEMRNEGLIDVPDASKIFLAERPLDVPGSIVVPTIEGTRPLLVEVQALVSSSSFMPPRRAADGVDIKRIQLLLAVLEKRVGMSIGAADVYVKVAGGINVDEPAIDLGLAVALASSFRNCQTSANTAVFGEIGLAGEVRAVTQVEPRIREAERMGFKRMILPQGNLKGLLLKTGMKLVGVETVQEGLDAALD
ncbi:DNA repair protein RadA/Sms [Sporomusaceae bacterium BoRhaA]|uniref:DNA repair protein RadA n=1 Tax=Pelorhabdus rhamnosifermentans TaxID=2772457 RepID=UPI001C060D25|nr:DNA repair protein RadA [Pelorhabdus rhamnosifermentans]MBU2701578.1 DNA repair protein RadA/Sms [Pelorhabdus rhamnosifermentans]